MWKIYLQNLLVLNRFKWRNDESNFNDKSININNEKYKYHGGKVWEENYGIYIIPLKQALNNGLVLKKYIE